MEELDGLRGPPPSGTPQVVDMEGLTQCFTAETQHHSDYPRKDTKAPAMKMGLKTWFWKVNRARPM